MSNINILQFQDRKIANRGNEKIYIILFVKEARTSYLRMSTHKVGEHLKKCVWSKISLIFYWFLLFFFMYTILWKSKLKIVEFYLNWLCSGKNTFYHSKYQFVKIWPGGIWKAVKSTRSIYTFNKKVTRIIDFLHLQDFRFCEKFDLIIQNLEPLSVRLKDGVEMYLR